MMDVERVSEERRASKTTEDLPRRATKISHQEAGASVAGMAEFLMSDSNFY